MLSSGSLESSESFGTWEMRRSSPDELEMNSLDMVCRDM